MSGKGSGKKRNRAAQSGQHGFQNPQSEAAIKPDTGEKSGAQHELAEEKQRVLDKLKRLERQRQEED